MVHAEYLEKKACLRKELHPLRAELSPGPSQVRALFPQSITLAKKPLASHINTYTLDAAAKPQMFSNKQRPLESHTFDQSQKKREQ